MHVEFVKNFSGTKTNLLEIDDARIIWPNFEGRGDKYNQQGNRNFNLVIPNQDIADALMNDVNEYGAGWTVKMKAPREEGDDPLLYMNVKVKFNDRGPEVYLISGNNRVRLDKDTIKKLDNISIRSVNLDIRPYDDQGSFGPFRSAYLSSLEVIQDISRFAARYAEEEYPVE